MKKLLFAIFLLGIGSVSAAPKQFEGDVSMKMTHEKQSVAMEQTIKGSKVKITMVAMAGMSSIMDVTSKKIVSLMPATKQYMEMDLPPSTAQPEPFKGKVKKTGRTKEILGYTAHEWVAEDKDMTAEAWIVPEFKYITIPEQQAGVPDVFKDAEGFPFVAKGTLKNQGSFELVVTKFNPRAVADSELQIPSGYKKVELPDMHKMQ